MAQNEESAHYSELLRSTVDIYALEDRFLRLGAGVLPRSSFQHLTSQLTRQDLEVGNRAGHAGREDPRGKRHYRSFFGVPR